MKCNQNCLKNAGNPRETRRFQVMIGLIRKNDILQLVTSENMFVHNNSKHGRRSNMVHDHLVAHSPNGNFFVKIDLAVKFPMIHYVIPQTGRLGGGDEVAILGEHFFEGIQIAFGNQFAFQTDVKILITGSEWRIDQSENSPMCGACRRRYKNCIRQ